MTSAIHVHKKKKKKRITNPPKTNQTKETKQNKNHRVLLEI